MSTTRRAVFCLFLLPFAIFMATKTRSQSRTAAAKPKSPASQTRAAGPLEPLSTAERQWVDTSLRRLTIDEKIGQLLFTTFHGTFTSTESGEYQKLLHDVPTSTSAASS
jgi:hypothetical protein